MTDKIKFYKTRDSAVAVLRKAGVPKDKYAEYLAVGPEGFGPRVAQYEADRNKAMDKEIIAKVLAADKPAGKKAAAKTEKNERLNGISEWIRGLIKAGKTNAEIKALAPAAGFDLTGKRQYFPGWYRWQMKKAGQL